MIESSWNDFTPRCSALFALNHVDGERGKSVVIAADFAAPQASAATNTGIAFAREYLYHVDLCLSWKTPQSESIAAV
jgi:hypothetical protein